MNVIQIMNLRKIHAYFFVPPVPFNISKIEEHYLPALISELVDMPILTVTPKYRVGRVMVFYVTPPDVVDPPLIFCEGVNLEDYYYMWREIARGFSINMKASLQCIDDVIQNLDLSKLEPEEGSFIILQLLKYKNDYVRTAHGY